MRRLLPPFLMMFLAACSASPAPAVQVPPPSPAPPAPEPAPAPAVDADAGAPVAAPVEVADAGPATVATEPATDAGGAAATSPSTAPTTRPATPAAAPAAGNPVAQGRAVFQRVCARCHEADDSDGPTPNKRWAEARMRAMVRNGNARMRAIPVSRLSEADLTLLVSYLRSTHAIQ